MKISKTIKKLHIFLMLSGICLFAAQSLWAVDFISARNAHDNAAAGTGVVIDVRTVEEHNGCNATWTGAFAGCPTDEIENRGAPAWTDTASGVQMQSINIPYWINSTGSDTLPQDTTEFGNSFQALLDSGYITASTPVYLLCRSGYRSYYGGVYIEGNGLNFTNVYSVDGAGVAAGGSGTGGMLEWYAANLPIPWNTDYSTIDRGYKGPQVLSITPTTGITSTTSSVDFTVGILEPTWGDTGGVMYYTTIERFSLYIDGVETEFTTSDPTSGSLWTTYTFTTTLADGTHTWDIRAESENRSDLGNNASNLISWNPNADLIGPGNRTITVSTVTLEANISVSPASLDFGSVTVGNTSSPQTITVTSDGTADLDITTITATGDFGIQNDTCSNQTIATGSTCTLDVVFSPASEGTLTGSISIPSNDPDTPTATVSLSGSGTAVPEANISVSPASLDFGSVVVGDTSSTQTITVTSDGTADLVITTITVTGDYSIQNDTCSNQTIATGSTCALDVVFSPASEGTLTGSVSIPSNDPDTSTATVSLSGSGTAVLEANISVSSASLDFGSVLVGDTSAPQTITVTSNGTADLVITTITVTGDFGIQNDTCSSQTIATGSNCTLDVVFSPASEGTLTGSISIPSNDPDTATATVSLSGSGTATPEANISVSPASLDFGSVVVGNTSSSQTITVTSNGTADLDITTITITGDFGIQNDTCSSQTIATGSTCTLDVVFSPASEGTLTGSISIPSNDPDTATATVSLSGSGTATPEANISVSSASLDFGSVVVGNTSAPQTITVSSTGTADLDITTITVTGDFGIQNDTCSSQTIATGSTCTLDVVFSPSAEGTLTGSISIPSNDPDTATATVSLSGSGSTQSDAILPAVGNIDGPELVSPTDESTVNSSLTLEWKPFTDAVSYEVYYCKNQDFSGTDIGCSGAEPIVVTSLGRNGVYFYAGSGLVFILFGLMVLGGIRQRGKLMLFAIAMMISSTMLIVSCQPVGDEDDTLYKRGGNNRPTCDESTNKTYDVSGLEAGQTYYWGVVAVDADGVKTASTAWSFTVN